jgi:O-methyltransferase
LFRQLDSARTALSRRLPSQSQLRQSVREVGSRMQPVLQRSLTRVRERMRHDVQRLQPVLKEKLGQVREQVRARVGGNLRPLVRRSAAHVRDRLRNDAHWLILSPVAREVLRQRLTYLSPRKLHTLERSLREVDERDVPGDFIECGVALGGSAIVMASQLSLGRRFDGYDVFGMIPPPSERDDEWAHQRYAVIRGGGSKGIQGKPYYGYLENLYAQVLDHFRGFGFEPDGRSIKLHRGLFEDTLQLSPGRAVAVAHIDCDWHDPVVFCLEAIYARLSPGGIIILDDYNDYGGCRTAADAFLARHDDMVLRSADASAVLWRRR